MSHSLLVVAGTISKDGQCREKALRALGSLFKAIHYHLDKSLPSSWLVKPSKTFAKYIISFFFN